MTRCAAAHSYFDCVQEALDQPPAWWLERYGRLRTLDISEIMAMLHPDIYVRLPPYIALAQKGLCPVRGMRGFKASHMPPRASCESRPLWMYQCTGHWRHASSLSDAFRTDEDAEDIHQDHLFPFCFGGVTHIENRGLLCGLHNSIKAHDVHIWPWESWNTTGVAPQWAIRALYTINSILTRAVACP